MGLTHAIGRRKRRIAGAIVAVAIVLIVGLAIALLDQQIVLSVRTIRHGVGVGDTRIIITAGGWLPNEPRGAGIAEVIVFGNQGRPIRAIEADHGIGGEGKISCLQHIGLARRGRELYPIRITSRAEVVAQGRPTHCDRFGLSSIVILFLAIRQAGRSQHADRISGVCSKVGGILVGQAGVISARRSRGCRHLISRSAQTIVSCHLATRIKKGDDGVDPRAGVVGNQNKAVTRINRELDPIFITGGLEAVRLAHAVSRQIAGRSTLVIRLVIVGDASGAAQREAIGRQGTKGRALLFNRRIVDPARRRGPVQILPWRHQLCPTTGIVKTQLCIGLAPNIAQTQRIGDAPKGGKFDPIAVRQGGIVGVTEGAILAWPFGNPTGDTTEVIIFITIRRTTNPHTDRQRDQVVIFVAFGHTVTAVDPDVDHMITAQAVKSNVAALDRTTGPRRQRGEGSQAEVKIGSRYPSWWPFRWIFVGVKGNRATGAIAQIAVKDGQRCRFAHIGHRRAEAQLNS